MHMRRTILCIAATFLWATHDPNIASGQSSWQSDMDAGVEAYVEGDYAEAGKQFEAAANLAEAFGQGDPRLATSLNGLAEVYRAQGRYTEAEPLHRRALAIREKARRPDYIIQSLNNLAGLYRDQGKSTLSTSPERAQQWTASSLLFCGA